MKFGHAFQEALAKERYPQHWVEKAIPYRQLKKILGKVREELHKNGYDPDTLRQLLADHKAEYRLEPDDAHLLHPELIVRSGVRALPAPVDTQEEVKEDEPVSEAIPPAVDSLNSSSPEHSQASRSLQQVDENGWVKIPMNADERFFSLLSSDVNELDVLQTQEQQSMTLQIHDLGAEISQVAKPRKGLVNFSKSDLYRWREIFEIYLAAGVFFSTSEQHGGLRNSEKARQQLIWFQEEVNKRQLPQRFKIESSAIAYMHFLNLNATLLQNLQFQELNQTAVTKIIKSKSKKVARGASSASFVCQPF